MTPTKIESPPIKALTQEIKATCHFLDADVVGVCQIDSEPKQWAVVILVQHPSARIDRDDLASWSQNDLSEISRLRATEIAVVLAGYIRQLGHDAAVVHGQPTDPHMTELAVAAGIGRMAGETLNIPFVGDAYTFTVVATTLPLTPNFPLRANGPLVPMGLKLATSLGFGGVRSIWSMKKWRRRATHLGRYPMERIRKVSKPTTLILDDEIPRVPKRASFFARAGHGDLGPKAQRERNRFATKHPLAFAMSPLMRALVPLQDGPVTDATPLPGNTDSNTRAIKSLAYVLGADMVGIGNAVPYAWYSHDSDGNPLPVRHKFAIVMLIDQGFDTSEGSSGDDWISGTQSMRAYLRGAEIACVLAAHIRKLGYQARAHTNRESDVLQLPLILHAGLGELSRIGELVLNPFLGPRSKSVVVTTDMPLAPDQPIDFGLQDFCSKCRKCARECPCNAISYKNKVMFNGYEMWKPDVERCTRYRVTNPKGSSCGRCMKVCPFTNEGLITHRFFLWLAVNVPFSRRVIIKLDDMVKNGARNPIKRWWRDLNRTETGLLEHASGTNERDLKIGSTSKVSHTQQIAYYPADLMPPPDTSEPTPIDRAKALAMEMETPDQALLRRAHS